MICCRALRLEIEFEGDGTFRIDIGLNRHEVTQAMPTMTPWKDTEDISASVKGNGPRSTILSGDFP